MYIYPSPGFACARMNAAKRLRYSGTCHCASHSATHTHSTSHIVRADKPYLAECARLDSRAVQKDDSERQEEHTAVNSVLLHGVVVYCRPRRVDNCPRHRIRWFSGGVWRMRDVQVQPWNQWLRSKKTCNSCSKRKF